MTHHVSLSTASTTAGALIRAGVYELGSPNSNNWDIGDRIADVGTLPADVAGHAIFEPGPQVSLAKGWYVTAIGVSGASAKAQYGRWLQPGIIRVYPHSTGTGARPRILEPSVYLYENSYNPEILGGLLSTWTKNPVTDITSNNSWTYQMFFPKWRIAT